MMGLGKGKVLMEGGVKGGGKYKGGKVGKLVVG